MSTGLLTGRCKLPRAAIGERARRAGQGPRGREYSTTSFSGWPPIGSPSTRSRRMRKSAVRQPSALRAVVCSSGWWLGGRKTIKFGRRIILTVLYAWVESVCLVFACRMCTRISSWLGMRECVYEAVGF